MNILLVNYEYPPVGGGAGNATWFLARSLAKLGHRPVVLTGCHGDLPRKRDEGDIRVYRCGPRRPRADRASLKDMALFLARAMMVATRMARRESIDACLVFFSVPCGPIALRLHRKLNLPYVVSLRGGDVPGFVPSLNALHRVLRGSRRRVLRHARAIVANAPGLAALSEGADPFPVQVIPNGVDADFFRPEPSQEGGADARRPGGPIGPRALRLLAVGRLVEQKNLLFLLRVVADLQRSGVDVQLKVVGDGPERDALAVSARALGIGDRLEWAGWIGKEALRHEYRQAECFANVSLYEGMPNVVLEAMASGLPVVASRIPGNIDLVIDNETGMLYEPGDAQGLQRAIAALAGDPARRRRMGRAARKRVEEQFTWGAAAEKYAGMLT